MKKEKLYHDPSMKLNDPNTSGKTYWSILKSFYNDSKIPLIPPLLVNNKIVSDFTEKANLFNDFFATQCTPLSDNNVLPSAISFKTQSRLSSINFEKKKDILKIIRNLKACVRYFYQIFIFNFLSFFSISTLPRLKRTNERGIIYEVMNWLA